MVFCCFSTSCLKRSADIVSPLALTQESFSKVVTVLDTSISSSSSIFAVHAHSAEETAFLTGEEIVKYLHSLETTEMKLQEIDFESLKADVGNAAASSAAAAGLSRQAQQEKKEKETAKIEGAVQIAIGVKKEVDFPTWYTSVSFGRTAHVCLDTYDL